MTHSFSTPRETAGYSLKRRTGTWLKRMFGTQMLKSQDLRFVTINGRRFKRLILHDSYLAAGIERNLEAFGESAHFPRLVVRHENEIWVEFVEGAPLRSVDDEAVARLAAFYAAIYAQRPPRQVATDESPFLGHVERNLRFLNQVGVLGDEAYGQLAAVAKRLVPPRVWVGFDYVDPVLKNFVLTGDGAQLCAIDVESLADDQLIGTGVAKAFVHWLEPHRHAFLEQLANHEVPDFQSYFGFVELAFLARWTKTKFLTGKWKFVDGGLFERFREL